MLFENLKSLAYDYTVSKIQEEDYLYITENLKYNFYEWQKNAFENFLLNEKIREAKFKKGEELQANHIMFNMATGSGKTLLMAALILYYYKQGYRYFIFFVNQNAILGKTQDNFINKNHNKYLFKENIVIEGNRLRIREVEIFDNALDDIQIKFTTIQKLHNDIYKENENSLLLSDLQKRDLILFGDEAHHLNVATSKIKKDGTENGFDDISFIGELNDRSSEKDIERSWENTICYRIFKKEGQKTFINKNVLLEFTATIPASEEIKLKYNDKIISKFDLKDFVQAGYTKHIRLVRSNLEVKERILQALLLNWYRYRIAAESGIANFKPVILFRSKTIEQSQKDYHNFLELCKTLTYDDFNFLHKLKPQKNERIEEHNNLSHIYILPDTVFVKIGKYIMENKLSFSDVVNYIKENFSERNILITNSKNGTKTKERTTPETERLLNNLEDATNHIRAIFTVQRLTEGWDVLNLYDIVRLYDGRDADTKTGKAGRSTTSEVQLIGRGVRYYPFQYNDKKPNKRKFDDDLQNNMRILEEFYFHSNEDHRYISELSNELKNQGLISDKRSCKLFRIKSDLQQTLQEMYIFINERKENKNRILKTLPDDFQNLPPFAYKITTGIYSEIRKVNFDDNEDEYKAADSGMFQTETIRVGDIATHILQKAVHRLNTGHSTYFSFENLKHRFDIKSIDDFFLFIKDVKILLTCDTDFEDIPNKKILQMCENFFLYLKTQIETYDKPFIGSDFKPVKFSDIFSFREEKGKICLIKEKLIMVNDKEAYENNLLEKTICSPDCKWYLMDAFWGTSEERGLIQYIKDRMQNLLNQYEVVSLLRNEQVYKIFSFDTGEGFQPDFLLFLQNTEKGQKACYQVFIESKGTHLIEKDKWKQDFLSQITKRYGCAHRFTIKDSDYVLIGLPFFNESDIHQKKTFSDKFEKIIESSRGNN